MFNLHKVHTERKLRHIHLAKDVFDEDYTKVHTWFGVFTNVISFKIRNKIVDQDYGENTVRVKGFKNE